MPQTDPCPCGSGYDYGTCCYACISGESSAPTAEALMRSRYSAFALGETDYLIATWHPSKRPSRVTLDPAQKWIGLSIKATEQGQHSDELGVVEFVARFKIAGKGHRLHERSRFKYESGQWYYLDGDHL